MDSSIVACGQRLSPIPLQIFSLSGHGKSPTTNKPVLTNCSTTSFVACFVFGLVGRLLRNHTSND